MLILAGTGTYITDQLETELKHWAIRIIYSRSEQRLVFYISIACAIFLARILRKDSQFFILC